MMRRPATTLALLAFSGLITSLDFTMFLINLPLVVTGVVAAFELLEPDGPRDRRRGFDVPGREDRTAATELAPVRGG